MKSLICRLLFMACIGGSVYLVTDQAMYAEAVLVGMLSLVIVGYDAATYKKVIK